jgi:hypothetical protein
MEIKTANSMSQFVRIVATLRDAWCSKTTYAKEAEYFDPWFRGQQNPKWLLQPNIFRLGLENEEDEIRAEFKRRAAQFMTELAPQDEWGWYFLMQHYGAPTRLLDWTDSALIALFFAVNSNSPERIEPTTDAVVWALDPWWLNAVVFQREIPILLPGWDDSSRYLSAPYVHRSDPPTLPAAIDPPFIARRVAVQHSHFTIFGTDPNGLNQLEETPGCRLVQIRLPKGKIDHIRLDLATCGIVDTTDYPDLTG